MWSERSEETRDSGKQDTMLQVWGGRTQEVGVSKNERYKEKKGRSTSTRSVEKGART